MNLFIKSVQKRLFFHFHTTFIKKTYLNSINKQVFYENYFSCGRFCFMKMTEGKQFHEILMYFSV